MDFLDFDLEIGVGRGRKYPLAVVRSPACEARETMQFPFDELALENQLLTLQNVLLRSGGKRRQILSPDEQAIQNFGRALFEALFTGEVRTRYALSQREAVHQGKGLRLKLRIHPPKLAALPWEFLYDTGQAEYVCLSRNTPIIRYLELPQPSQPLSVKLPLHILGMIASPKDLADLDAEREKQRVEKALQHLQAKGMVELTWLPGQTWQDLQLSMRRGPWHIFHFSGHGGFDPNTDEGLIALKDDEGRAQHLSATHLGRLLADHRALRLVVLNSCEGARGSEKDIFSSTAAILVRRGIPAVLAMQYEITDRAAIELSRAFYEALADGLPVDMAVSEARKAISLGVVNTVEWGTPLLYMRSPDGVLFDLIQNPAIHEERPAPVSVPPLLPIPPTTLPPSRTPSTDPPAPADANQPMQIQQQPSHATPPATSSLSQQAHPSQSTRMYGKPRRLLFSNNRMRNLILFVLAILLITAVASFPLIRTRTPVATVPPLPNGIGVTKAPEGEYIGVSDGTFAFDTNRPDGRFKTQAADKLKAGDVSEAQSLWQSGLTADTNDAEAFIYLEDQRVLTSGNPYITLVVGTFITGDSVDVGRYDLQGAYIAQREFNNGHKLSNNLQVRLLIANSGNVATYATAVAQQIVQAAQQDHTIVGVMGWPYSSPTLDVIGVLAKAHIPMVSQDASSDQLTRISSYFFRVVPSNKGQAIAGAHYAEGVLHARNVALFVDPADSYSSSLATDFSQQFVADGNHIVVTENYTVGSQGHDKLPMLLQDALSHNPDLIYFSGDYLDIRVLLENLPTTGPSTTLQVLSGDAQCEVGGYACSASVNFTRLHFTKFAYADEWDNAALKAQKPAFFNEYSSAYNPNGQQPAGKYGYTRPTSDAMTSYDATLALLTASKMALKTPKSSLTPNDILQGLRQIMGAYTLQGVSGPIAFGSDGDPINKPFVVLAVDTQGRVHEERLQGCLLVGPCS